MVKENDVNNVEDHSQLVGTLEAFFVTDRAQSEAFEGGKEIVKPELGRSPKSIERDP
jgi:hypothetical protein